MIRHGFITALLIVWAFGNLMADDRPGYTDGPQLPDSKWKVHDRDRPQPVRVAPGQGDLGVTAPSDAVVLFDGKDLAAWQRADGKDISDPTQTIESGIFDITKTGTIRTKQEFGDYQLHLEWMTPTGPEDRMNWGNSGVFLMDRFEIQILESHDSHIYADGNAGAIYGQYPAMVNPARKPGQWQSFDIIFTTPKFDGDRLTEPARATVIYNGMVVQNNRAILGTAAHRQLPGPYPVKTLGPVGLQDHHSAVKFRNIWIRPLRDAE